MENANTYNGNNWSSFSQTTTSTIVVIAILNLIYLLLQQISVRLDTFELNSAQTITQASASSTSIFTTIQVILFFALFPTMYWIRYQIRHGDTIQVPNFPLFRRDYPGLAIFLGSITGIFIFMCVRFTIRSLWLS